MVIQIDYNKNTCCNNGKYHFFPNCRLQDKFSWDSHIPVPSWILPWDFIIVFIVACFCFFNSVYGEFVFDDSEAVINNSDVKPETPVSTLFRNDFWGTKLTHNMSHKSYRPFTVLTFRINYRFVGFEPFTFHFVNIILHGIVSILILKVMSIIFHRAVNEQGAPKAAIICALLFAVHPIHTESVSAVVGRADLLCAIFFLLSFLLYTHALHANLSTPALSWYSFCCLFASLLLAGTSMLCKEQGITVIGICFVYDFSIFSRFDFYDVLCYTIRRQELSSLFRNIPIKNNPSSFIMRQFILAVGGSILLTLRWYIMGASAPVFQQVDNPASFEDNILIRVVNYHYIYAMNAWLLFHPLWLCFDWSMGCIPLIRSATDSRLIAIIVFWSIFSFLIYGAIAHRSKRTRRLLCMALAFVLVPFLPASNLLFRVGFVVAERALYLPSMGYCLLVVIGMRQLSLLVDHNYQPVIQGSFILLIIAFTARCIQRSIDWRTEETLFRSGLKVCPLNAKVHYNIAKNAADNSDRDVAVEEYKEAIRLNPSYDQAMNNLANILKDKGQLIEAEKLLLSAIQIRSDFAAAWMNLGIVQSSLKKMENAEKSYLMAIRYRKRYPDCYYNLGNLYLEQKKFDDAYRAWRNATSLQSTHLVAWNNMVIMLDSIGDLLKAESVAKEALQYLPFEASLHFNLANTLGKASKYDESEQHFLQAIKLNGNNPTYHTNLGVLYHRWKKYDLAEESYKRAIKLKSDMKSAQENLQLLYRVIGRV